LQQQLLQIHSQNKKESSDFLIQDSKQNFPQLNHYISKIKMKEEEISLLKALIPNIEHGLKDQQEENKIIKNQINQENLKKDEIINSLNKTISELQQNKQSLILLMGQNRKIGSENDISKLIQKIN
jgi:hypothetical protein